jgi:hypothetical protein
VDIWKNGKECEDNIKMYLGNIYREVVRIVPNGEISTLVVFNLLVLLPLT